jgi:glycosyltransferase involved in cell wall biosynthesis
MITRKVDKNDPQAGFIYNWVKKLGRKVDQLKVICLEKGNSQGLPKNIEVFSLGKEKGKNRLKEFINFQRGALKFIIKVDGVFCHQNPEYTILIAPYAKLFRKKIVTWYAHKHIDWRVKLIGFLANQIVTSTKAGFRLDSPKKKIIGQGIDTDFFKPALDKSKSEKLRIISVGRISPIKNYETLIKAADILKKQDISFKVNIAGQVILEKQEEYFNKLKEMVRERQLEDYLEFLGGVPQNELVELYQNSDLAVNLCPTGAPDKAGFEAMACGLPLLASNQSYTRDFGPYTDQLLFREKDPDDLAKKISGLAQSNQLEEIGLFLRKQVIKHHNLDKLLEGIIQCF